MPDLHLSVFAEGVGRVDVQHWGASAVESGGAILVDQNRYMGELADKFNIPRKRMKPKQMVVFDGKQVLFQTSPWSVVSVGKLLWRYGKTLMAAKGTSAQFAQEFAGLYQLQDGGVAWETPQALLQAVGLWNATQVSLNTHLALDGSTAFEQEMLTGIVRNIYNQNASSMTALAGLVALAPLSLGTAALWQAEGGNHRMFQAALSAYATTLSQGAKVLEVAEAEEGTPGSGYRLLVQTGGRVEWTSDTFAAVVVAAPLEHAGLTFTGPLASRMPPPRPWTTTYVTFVQGVLNPAYFHVSTAEDFGDVLATKDVQEFSSLGLQFIDSPLSHPTFKLYKLFSVKELDSRALLRVFKYYNVDDVRRVQWDAYPTFTPPQAFPSFKLAPGLFYVNALEGMGSCMEVMAVAARNVAALVHHHLHPASGPDTAVPAGAEPAPPARGDL